jgi:hypothetical protein
MPAPTLRTRLNCETMEAREVMSADLGIEPGFTLGQTSMVVETLVPADAIPVAAEQQADGRQPVPLRATPGVTRIPPTPRDRMFISRLANKQWSQVVTFTNPLSGNFVEQYNELSLARGLYSLQSLWIEYTPFGPVSYPALSQGRWWVQNNGRLVLQDYDPTSASRYTFMTLRAVNNRALITTDNGRWERFNGPSRIPGQV